MTEVMRWKLKGFVPGVEGVSKALFQPWVVQAEDFDNATRLFLDAAERCVAAERREKELQQRLTAADERADVLGLDAARYRWLRDPDNQEDLEPDSDYLMPPIICGYAEHEDILSMEALDKAIDSAMSEAPKP